jgi:hypothetical protein
VRSGACLIEAFGLEFMFFPVRVLRKIINFAEEMLIEFQDNRYYICLPLVIYGERDVARNIEKDIGLVKLNELTLVMLFTKKRAVTKVAAIMFPEVFTIGRMKRYLISKQ